MSATNPLPDNSVLLYLQDERNNDYLTVEAIAEVYAESYSDDAHEPQEDFLQDDRQHSFLIFTKMGTAVPTASIIHHLACFPTCIGRPTIYNGGWYGTVDQPIGGHQITVELPADMFSIGDPVQTFMPNRIQDEVGNDPDLEQLVPEIVNANLEDLELLTSHRSVWIPNQYAALCMDENLTPVEVWKRCYGAILQNGHQNACRVLIQFCAGPAPRK